MNIVPHPIQVPLNDLPGRLRQLADDIERGVKVAPLATLLLVGVEAGTGLQLHWCFGDNPSRAEVVGHYTMAATRLGRSGP